MSSASERAPPGAARATERITVRDRLIAYGSFVLLRAIDFVVRRGDVFTIMGGSGCGKTTLMRAMIGLKAPAGGAVLHGETSFWDAPPEAASS